MIDMLIDRRSLRRSSGRSFSMTAALTNSCTRCRSSSTCPAHPSSAKRPLWVHVVESGLVMWLIHFKVNIVILNTLQGIDYANFIDFSYWAFEDICNKIRNFVSANIAYMKHQSITKFSYVQSDILATL